MRFAWASAGAGVGFAACLTFGVATAQAPSTASGDATTEKKAPPGVLGTRDQVFDAWLAADAAVTGTYRGVDSTRGPQYHVLEVDEVWMGTPAPGRLAFKAPRGVRAERGDRGLFFLWDRLAGAPDGFLEESKARYGDDVWRRIGPDSVAAYLLPFPSYAYPFTGDKLVLRGQSAFATEIPVRKLALQLQDFEKSLQPTRLFEVADTVLRAHVEAVQLGTRTEHGIIIERWVLARLRKLEVYKGQAADTLSMRFISFPRAPRFKQDEELILFLTTGPQGPYLEQGKRAVLHVIDGEVVEAGRPLAEFLKALRAQ